MKQADTSISSDFYTKSGFRLLLDRKRFDDIHRILALTTEDGRNVWYERKGTQDPLNQLNNYQNDINLVAEALRQHLVNASRPSELGTQLGLLCLCYLITASLVSVSERTSAELVIESVRAGYRSPAWGKEMAQFINNDEARLAIRMNLVEYLPDEDKQTVFDELLSQISSVETIEYLSENLPEFQLVRLREAVMKLSDEPHGLRALGLATLAERFTGPTRSELLTEALTAAHTIRNTRGHILTLLKLIPQMPKKRQDELWNEFMESFIEGALGLPDLFGWHNLVTVADFKRLDPKWFINVIDHFVDKSDSAEYGSFSLRARDKLLGLFVSRLLKNKRYVEAFQVYEAIQDRDVRIDALVSALAYLEYRWLYLLLFPARRMPFRQRLRRSLLAMGWLKMSKAEQTQTYRVILDQVTDLSDDSLRRNALYRLLPHLPDGLAADAFQSLLENVDEISEPKEHAGWLAHLAADARDQRRERLFARAFDLTKIDDSSKCVALRSACVRLLDNLEPANTRVIWDRNTLLTLVEQEDEQAVACMIENIDHLPKPLISLAWEVAWCVGRQHGELTAGLVARMVELGENDYAYEYLNEIILGWPIQEFSLLLKHLPFDRLTSRVWDYVVERVTSVKEAHDARIVLEAIGDILERVPETTTSAIVEWFGSHPIEFGQFADQIMACLIPLYGRAGYLNEAYALMAAIRAHDEKAEALVALAHYVKEPERSQCLQEALDLLSVPHNEKVWSGFAQEFMQAFGPRVGATGRWSANIIQPSKSPHLLAQIATLGPSDAAIPVWREAVSNINSDTHINELTPYVQQMPVEVARLAVSQLARMAHENNELRQTDLLLALFRRLQELGPRQQLDELADYLQRIAAKGRPRLMADLTTLAPLLQESGGNVVLHRLREAVELVMRWWE